MKHTKTKKTSKKTLGVIQAIIVAFHQGFEGVLLVLFGITTIFAATQGGGVGAAWGAAVLGAKEMLALTITVLIIMIKRGPEFFKELFAKLKTKQGLFFTLAGMIGTSMGNLFYILGIVFAGAGYGVVLTALYPIFSMLLVKFVMKETENKMVWLGAAVAVVSGFLLVLLPAILEGSKSNHSQIEQIVGMLFGMMAAFFWALEGLFINLGLKTKLPKGQSRFSSIEIIMTRNIFTTLVTVGVVMPVMCIMAPSFSYIGQIFSNWQAGLIVLSIAVNIIILRHFHVKAINNIGPKITAIIDTNNFIVPALMAQIFVAAAPVALSVYSGATIIWWAYILMIPVMVGVFMVLYFHESHDEAEPLDFVNWHQDVENDNDEFTI